MSNQIQSDNHPNSKSQKAIIGEHVLYDFTLCSLPQFAHLRMEVHGGCLTEPFANEFVFSSIVRDMFARCFDVNNKLEQNDLYSEEYPRFVYALMERYAYHIHQAYQSNPRDGIRLMFDWLLKTREIFLALVIVGVLCAAVVLYHYLKTTRMNPAETLKSE